MNINYFHLIVSHYRVSGLLNLYSSLGDLLRLQTGKPGPLVMYWEEEVRLLYWGWGGGTLRCIAQCRGEELPALTPVQVVVYWTSVVGECCCQGPVQAVPRAGLGAVSRWPAIAHLCIENGGKLIARHHSASKHHSASNPAYCVLGKSARPHTLLQAVTWGVHPV